MYGDIYFLNSGKVLPLETKPLICVENFLTGYSFLPTRALEESFLDPHYENPWESLPHLELL